MVQEILPKWERWTYWVVGICGIFYSWWRVFAEGDALKKKHLGFGLRKKWSFLDRPHDFTDSEWTEWMINLKFYLILCLIHIATSQICRLLRFSVAVRLCSLVLCDLGCLCAFFGYKVVVFFLLKTLLVYIVSQLGSVAGIWIVLGAEIVILTIPKAQDLFFGLTTQLGYESALGFLILRLISFGVDNAQLVRKNLQNEKICVPSETTLNEKKITSTDNTSLTGNTNSNFLYLLESLLYLFYFPSFIYGPVIRIADFRPQIKASFAAAESSPTFLPKNFISVLKNLMRLVFWMLFMEFSLHFLYFGAIAYNSVLNKLSFWALAAVGHLAGQFFMIKYLVIYGIAGQLGRFDGVNPYSEPRCISWVYSYTDMWRYFDIGLYKFITTYLYLPLGGSRRGLIPQLATTGVVFLFIYFWHGGTKALFIWCCGNYLVCSIEQLGGAAEKSLLGQRLASAIGPAVQLRVKCFLSVFTYLASCLQTFFFLLHVDDATEMFQTIVLESNWLQFGTMVGIIYACIHNAKFLDCKLGKHEKLS